MEITLGCNSITLRKIVRYDIFRTLWQNSYIFQWDPADISTCITHPVVLSALTIDEIAYLK